MDERCQRACVTRRPFRTGGYDHGGDRFPSRPQRPAPAPRAWHLWSTRPKAPQPATTARKRHEKGTKRAWFGHGFSDRKNRNHRLCQRLRRRKKFASAQHYGPAKRTHHLRPSALVFPTFRRRCDRTPDNRPAKEQFTCPTRTWTTASRNDAAGTTTRRSRRRP